MLTYVVIVVSLDNVVYMLAACTRLSNDKSLYVLNDHEASLLHRIRQLEEENENLAQQLR